MTLAPKNNTYISQKDAALILMISTGTVRRLIADGKLTAYRFGNQIRIVEDSLNDYINKQKI